MVFDLPLKSTKYMNLYKITWFAWFRTTSNIKFWENIILQPKCSVHLVVYLSLQIVEFLSSLIQVIQFVSWIFNFVIVSSTTHKRIHNHTKIYNGVLYFLFKHFFESVLISVKCVSWTKIKIEVPFMKLLKWNFE